MIPPTDKEGWKWIYSQLEENTAAWCQWYPVASRLWNMADKLRRICNEIDLQGRLGELVKGCNDSTGREIHLEDLVVRDGKEAIVVHIITTEEVQICPCGDGLPEVVHPASLTVRSSFIEKLKGLASNEELLAILASVENRQTLARSAGGEKKVSSGPKIAKVKETIEVDI